MIKSQADIVKMRAGGIITAGVMSRLMEMVKPGTNLLDINSTCADLLKSLEAAPSVKNYKGFPGNLCISVNDEIIHGIPRSYIIQPNDVVKLDLVVRYKGFHTDTAVTVEALHPTGASRHYALIQSTEQALYRAIRQIKPGCKLSDIAHAIHAEGVMYGCGVVRGYGGHGIGREFHEPPHIPNVVADIDKDIELMPGMVIAIEPMFVDMGPNADYYLDTDGWTVKTKTGCNAAHFEHTVLITETGCEVLTRRG